MKKNTKMYLISAGIVALVIAIALGITAIKNSEPTQAPIVNDSDTPYAKAERPWEEDGAKQPSDYTWEEFNELSPEQQEIFFESFESVEDFDMWMERAQSGEIIDDSEPWKVDGAKQPSDYTWDEFNELSPEQQERFFESFENAEAFDEWMNRVNPE